MRAATRQRNGGGRASTTTVRGRGHFRGRGGSTSSNQHQHNNKKKCSRGMKCPYLHEQQHMGEYYHQEETQIPKIIPFAGRGRTTATLPVFRRNRIADREVLAAATAKRLNVGDGLHHHQQQPTTTTLRKNVKKQIDVITLNSTSDEDDDHNYDDRSTISQEDEKND